MNGDSWLRSGTTKQIHDQAGRILLAVAVNPFYQDGSELLSKEESPHKENVAIPTESNPRKQP